MGTLPSRHSPPQVSGADYGFIQSFFEEIDASELIERLEEYRPEEA